MVIKKTGKKKYPLKVYPKKGKAFWVPSQHKFSNDFVDKHGCSLVAFYIAMMFIGKHKTMSYLLKWSRKHLNIESKIPVSEVYKGLKSLAPKSKRDGITYRKKVTKTEVRNALARGYLVLLETEGPIHTNPLMWDDTKLCVRNFSNGDKKSADVNKMVDKQCDSKTYRGCVFIRP